MLIVTSKKMIKEHKINIFYGVCVVLILYFISSLVSTSFEISEKELYEKEKNKDVLNLYEINIFNSQYKTFKNYGEYINSIIIYLLNIIFTLVIMLKIYIDEDE